MRFLNLEQTAEYLDSASIEASDDQGHAIVHTGINATGVKFIMINDAEGETVVSESA